MTQSNDGHCPRDARNNYVGFFFLLFNTNPLTNAKGPLKTPATPYYQLGVSFRTYNKNMILLGGHPSCPATLVAWAQNAAVIEYQ